MGYGSTESVSCYKYHDTSLLLLWYYHNILINIIQYDVYINLKFTCEEETNYKWSIDIIHDLSVLQHTWSLLKISEDISIIMCAM